MYFIIREDKTFTTLAYCKRTFSGVYTYFECFRRLNVRIGEQIGISPLTKKQFKPDNSFVANDLLFWSHSVSYDGFSIHVRAKSKKYLPELKDMCY